MIVVRQCAVVTLLNNRESTKKIVWACDWYPLKALEARQFQSYVVSFFSEVSRSYIVLALSEPVPGKLEYWTPPAS